MSSVRDSIADDPFDAFALNTLNAMKENKRSSEDTDLPIEDIERVAKRSLPSPIDEAILTYNVNKYYPNGFFYRGQILDEKRHGTGNLYKDEQLVYSGEWKLDLPDGKGLFFWSNFSYEGQLQNGEFHGFGKLNYPNGKSYEGQWSQGKYHGPGVLKAQDGRSFNGNWENGNPVEEGTLTDNEGKIFVGRLEKKGQFLEFFEHKNNKGES